MKILSKQDAWQLLNGETPDTYVSRLSSRLRLVGGTYSIPCDSGAKTALSRLLAYLLLRRSSVVVYVSGWSVWPSSENLDLFYGYRRSIGETRPLIEAPVHVFEGADHDAFVSILCMVFYFFWDAWVVDVDGRALARITHDEWLELWADDEDAVREFAAELDKHRVRLLTH